MHCAKCGNKLEEGAKFCGKCGNVVGQTDSNISNNDAPKEVSKSKSVLVGIFSILAFIVAFAGVRYLTQEGISSVSQNSSLSKQELINETVAEVRNTTTFPMQLDEVTVWTGITGTSNALRYQYTLQDIDESQVSSTVLKNLIAPSVCTNTDTRYILNKDINMEYSYAVQGSAQTYFFIVSKSDCR